MCGRQSINVRKSGVGGRQNQKVRKSGVVDVKKIEFSLYQGPQPLSLYEGPQIRFFRCIKVRKFKFSQH